MSRLIWVPQFPVKMRYQEWWITEFSHKLSEYFDEVLILGFDYYVNHMEDILIQDGGFSNGDLAINFELVQINELIQLELKEDDILLASDISYPGLFCNALFHKRPNKCFAICHASAQNKLDIWEPIKKQKWLQECGIASLMNGVFVATEYHKQKLNWDNTHVVGLPFYKFDKSVGLPRELLFPINSFASASRVNPQKIDMSIEIVIEKYFGEKIKRLPECGYDEWLQYYQALADSQVLIISAKEETFGYQIADVILGTTTCVPLAPNDLCYPELLPSRYLYDRYDTYSLIEKIQKVKDGKLKKPTKLKNQKLVDNFFSNIAKIMLA